MKKRYLLLAGVVMVPTLWGAPGSAEYAASFQTGQTSVTKLARAGETCGGLPATIVGTPGPDTLVGTEGPDVIWGGDGDDAIDGLGGNDVICGGVGADTILGGAGDDTIYGGADAFWVDGRGDHKVGDLIDPGPGNDVIDPVWDQRRSRDETIPDRITYATSPVPVKVDLSAAATTGTVVGDGTDTITTAGPVGVIGSQFADTMNGSPRDDYFEGGPGGDTINGLGGNDVLWAEGPVPGSSDDDDKLSGGDGIDYLYSYRGRDTLLGGAEIDTIVARSGDPANVNGGAGNDALFVNIVRGGGTKIDGSSGIDVLTLGTTFGDPGSRPTLKVNLATGSIDSGQGGGQVKGVEQVVVDDYVSVDFNGSNRGELVGVARGGSLDARMNGGSDFAYGSFFNDRLDGGKGKDSTFGMRGTDTCTATENRYLCE